MGPTGLAEGYAFAGRYRVLRCIAAGGMGAVYEVVHVATDRRVALKVMLPELVGDGELRERFQREARVTANIASEHIVAVLDAGVDAQTEMPFLVMELLDGEELAERVERTGPLPPADVVTYLRQVASALDKTHAAGIVHRDLKPENLFLSQREDGSPRVKILDFGISKVVKDGSASANMTKSLGTPLYMAPEQFTTQPLAPATDLYALALIAYTLLVGTPYFQEEADTANSIVGFAMQAAGGPVESSLARAARRGVTLPASFEPWFRRATAREPAARFAKASDLVSALAEALHGWTPSPVSVTGGMAAVPSVQGPVARAASVPVEPWSQSRPGMPARRSRRPLIAIAGVALAAVAAAGSYVARGRHDEASNAASAAASVAPPSLTTARPAEPTALPTSTAADAADPRRITEPVVTPAPVASNPPPPAEAAAAPRATEPGARPSVTARKAVRPSAARTAAAAAPAGASPAPAPSPPKPQYTRD